ncbi:ammonia channel protein, partial [Tsukamurella pulmonis]
AAAPAAPAPQAPEAPAAPAAAPAPQRTRPRLTGPEWAAAAAMIVLVLAVLLGLALA